MTFLFNVIFRFLHMLMLLLPLPVYRRKPVIRTWRTIARRRTPSSCL